MEPSPASWTTPLSWDPNAARSSCNCRRVLASTPSSFGDFFTALRRQYDGAVVCEPRHASWFAAEPETLLTRLRVGERRGRPALGAHGDEPGGWGGMVYHRLHGSPQIYHSTYPVASLVTLAESLVKSVANANTWCIFDNTALGAATGNALFVARRTEEILCPRDGI